MDIIRVAIADANTLLREGLKRILCAEPDLLVIGEAENNVEALRLVERAKPDVLLLDLKLPENQAAPLVEELRQKDLPTRVLILSGSSRKESILNTARVGACGFVLKQTSSPTLIEAIRSVYKGGMWVDRQLDYAETFLGIARRLQAYNPIRRPETISRALSKRQQQILSCVAMGLSNQEISERLLIRLSTVKVHLGQVFRKLSVNNRTQAVLLLLNANQSGIPDHAFRTQGGALGKFPFDPPVFGDFAPGPLHASSAHLSLISANQNNLQP